MKWFRHDLESIDSDQIFELIEIHSFQGYGVWWYVVEQCYKAEETGFQVEVTDVWLRKAAKKGNLTDWRTIPRILDTMSDVGLIDSQLWAEHIIHVPGIQKRSDAYMKKKAQDARRAKKYRDTHKNVTHDASVTEGINEESPVTACDTPENPSPDYRSHISDLRSQTSEEQLIKEQESESESPKQVTLVDGTTRNPCLAPAPPKKSKPTKVKGGFDEQAWIEAYNSHKPDSWPECRGLGSKARKDGVKAAIQACVDEQQALETFAIALSWVRVGGSKTRFWREECNNPCFEVLLRPTKLQFLGLAEQGISANINPSAIAGSGFSDEDIRKARREKHIQEAMKRWS